MKVLFVVKETSCLELGSFVTAYHPFPYPLALIAVVAGGPVQCLTCQYLVVLLSLMTSAVHNEGLIPCLFLAWCAEPKKSGLDCYQLHR